MRRKGVPCGCTDNGGCCGLKEKLAILWDRTIGSILKINDQTPDGDGKFEIRAGDNIEVSDISNGIEIGMKNPLTDDVTIQADLTVDGDIVANGDIIQNGSAYETHAEKIYTNDDYIIMREGAVGPLGSGDYSGFQVTKYDGTNDGRLVIDRDGTARVGDVGDEQPLATRDESADLTDEHLVKWDATNQKLVDAGVDINGIPGFEPFCKWSTGVFITTPNVEELETFTLPTGYKFDEKYDYFVFINNSSGSSVNVTMKQYALWYTRDVTTFQMYVQASGDFYANIYVYRVKNEDSTPTVPVHVVTPGATDLQEKLVSGTNIKTVGGQSLLGSGDVPAGGLVWTLRAANNDWSDMFEVSGTTITAKKNIVLIEKSSGTSIGSSFINKGMAGTNISVAKATTFSFNNNSLRINSGLLIRTTDVPSSSTSIHIYQWRANFTTDGSTITITDGGNAIPTTGKSNFEIYTAD